MLPEMHCVRHPYQKGIARPPGIEDIKAEDHIVPHHSQDALPAFIAHRVRS